MLNKQAGSKKKKFLLFKNTYIYRIFKLNVIEQVRPEARDLEPLSPRLQLEDADDVFNNLNDKDIHR